MMIFNQACDLNLEFDDKKGLGNVCQRPLLFGPDNFGFR
jgi:hypothetical protein